MNATLSELFQGHKITLADAAARLCEDDYNLKLSVAYLLRKIITEGVFDHDTLTLSFRDNTSFDLIGWDDIMALSKLWLKKPYDDELTMIKDFNARIEELRK